MSTGGAFTLAEKRESRLHLDCLYRYARQLERGLGADLMRHSLLYAGDRMLPSEFVNLIQNKMAGMEEALGGPGSSPAPGEESLIDIDVESFKVVSRGKAPSTASSADRVTYTLQLPPALASVANIVHVAPCHNATLYVVVAPRERLPWETRKRFGRSTGTTTSALRPSRRCRSPSCRRPTPPRARREVIDQSTFEAWAKLLSQRDPEAKKERSASLTRSLPSGAAAARRAGPVAATAGAVLDGLVEAAGTSARA